MYKRQDPTILTGRVKLAIQEHIRKLYDKIGITEDYRSLYEPDPDGLSLDGMRKKRIFTLSDFYDAIKDDEELIEAANCLKTFTRYGGVKSRSDVYKRQGARYSSNKRPFSWHYRVCCTSI